MELVFQKFPLEPSTPGPGEIHLQAASAEYRQRRDLATLVLELGPAALLQGPGDARRVVVNADPTLDDMLAASFLMRQLQGQTLSPGCRAYARYASLVREGLRPAQFPLEQSMEGIFLAIRAPLTLPSPPVGKEGQSAVAQPSKGGSRELIADTEVAQTFTSNWERMASTILQAADEGKDPFTTPLFATGAQFARERAFLAKDLDVYRLDFAQGTAWEVRLPEGPARALGLLLHGPKSLLFKYWSRMECPAPMGGPYLFLAVDWGNGQWVFSTDPVQQISIKSLADVLQDAEQKHASRESEQDHWFDGKPFQHTMVASPRNGSKLPDKMVLRTVTRWCRARPAGQGRKRWCALALIAGCLLVAGFLFWYFHFSEPALAEIHDLHVLSIGVSKYQNIRGLFTADRDAEALTTAFTKQKGVLFKEVFTRVLKNEEATRAKIIDEGLGWWLRKDQSLTRWSLVIVTFSGHGFVDRLSNHYHFAPYDYDQNQSGSTGIYLADLHRYVASLPCTVVLIFDTCHSGAANEVDDEAKDDARKLMLDIKKYVTDSRDFFAKGRKGLVIMAACGPEQLANETKRWKHGALTLALLEGIEGKYRYQGAHQPPLPKGKQPGKVTLHDLDQYVTQRVEALSAEMINPQNRGQAVNIQFTGSLVPEQIPIASYGTDTNPP